jgi:hypothetical protein
MAAELDIIGYLLAVPLMVLAGSFVLGETRFFRLAERTGLAIAIGLVASSGILGIRSVFEAIMNKGEYYYLLWIALGFLIWFRASRGSLFYYSRLPVALYTGAAMAMLFVGRVHSGIVKIVIGTVQDPFQLNNFVFISFLILTLLYFVFSLKPSRYFRVFNRLGLYVIMIGLGNSFGAFALKRVESVTACWIFFVEALKKIFGG